MPIWRPLPAASALAVAALLCAGCRDAPEVAGAVRLATPIPKGDFVLTDTGGRPFHFARDTDGYVTLLFFGYTHCPDVCPVQMANVAATLHRLPDRVARQFRIVFVTTDPARDTSERLRAWLDDFDRGFIGLSGTPVELAAVQRQYGLAPAIAEPADAAGGYRVGHGAQIFAFTRDGLAHVVFPFGTRQVDWARELPRLAEGET